MRVAAGAGGVGLLTSPKVSPTEPGRLQWCRRPVLFLLQSMPMPKRHYVLNEGRSSKFWEIDVSGSSYTVRYGRIGTDGQTKTKELDSAADAKSAKSTCDVDVTPVLKKRLKRHVRADGCDELNAPHVLLHASSCVKLQSR